MKKKLSPVLIRFRRVMRDRDLSLREAAILVGCSKSALVSWLKGRRSPSRLSRIAINQATGGAS